MFNAKQDDYNILQTDFVKKQVETANLILKDSDGTPKNYS